MEENLIFDNKKLIYSVANIYKGLADINDLYQAGCKGLIEAYQKYDNSRNTKFSTFAYPYILGEVSKCVREENPIKVSRDISNISKKIESVRSMCSQELGRSATNEEVASYMGVSIDVFNEAYNSINCVDSLDYTYGDDGNLDMYDMIGESMDIDTIIMIKDELDKLDPIDKQIILSRYMDDLTQVETAKRMGINQVAVSRREQKVISMMKKSLSY